MKKHLILLLAVLCAAPVFAKFVVCEEPQNQGNPVIFEDKVFWTDSRLIDKDEEYGNDQTIYGSELFFKQLPYGNDTWIKSYYSVHEPDVCGNYIVYKQLGTTAGFVYSLSAQKILDNVPNTNTIVDELRIHNNIVVWSDSRNDYGGSNNFDIYGYNLNTSTEFPIYVDQISGGSPNRYRQTHPVVYESIVVWDDFGDYPSADSNIRAKNLATGEVFDVCTASGNQSSPEIYGNMIVWRDERNNWGIYGFNIDTRTEFPITPHASNPKIYGDIVVYSKSTPDIPGIYGYNLKSQNEFLISGTKINGSAPDIYGEIVVWPEIVFADQNLYGENIEKVQSEAIALGQIKSGTTVGNTGLDFTKEGINDTIDTWYNFTAPADGDYIITTFGSDFDTTLAVFDNDYNEFAFNDDYTCKQSKLMLKAEAGIKYYIRIAGYNKKVGNYRLSVISDGPEPLMSDINSDGNVNTVDLSILASEWLKSNN